MTPRPSGLGRCQPAHSILLGTLVVAVADGLDAILFFGARGVRPMRIFQSIASGLLGPASFSGALPAALLGVALHVTVAAGIVTAYYFVSRRIVALRRHTLVWGPLYGLAAWTVMNFVIVPLSRVDRAAFTWPVVLNGLLIHALAIGPASAWFSRDPDQAAA